MELIHLSLVLSLEHGTQTLAVWSPIIFAIVSALTAAYTVYKGFKTDKAADTANKSLNVSTNIQTVYAAQNQLINELQEEVKWNNTQIKELREENHGLRMQLNSAARKIQRLEQTLGDSSGA